LTEQCTRLKSTWTQSTTAALFFAFGLVATMLVAPALTPIASAEDPGREEVVGVYSPSMNRSIPVWVLRAADAGRPVVYLLNGVDGGESGGSWTGRSDVAGFFASKNVNVVVPLAGRSSYYTDWIADDPILGRNKWSTFLTRELPPFVNSRFATSGRNAIAGLSMSATSALDLAIESPGLYQAVGSFSGCARTADPLAQALVFGQVATFGGNAANMWGPPGAPAWADHDPLLNADRLRGKALYIAAGTGMPGPHDTLNAPGIDWNLAALADRATVGGVMEAAVNQCTGPLLDRLRALGIPVSVNLQPTGTHSWPYWQDDLHNFWPILAGAVGA
jgi:diacylglycerol O-acyltransferase / trehalose O-mycolyltransferase